MCDTFVATPEYTADGKMILGKNSDREPNEAQAIIRYPQTQGQKGLLQTTFVKIPQAQKTNEIILSKPFQMWGAEMGINECGVAIGNEAVFTKLKPAKTNNGLTGMDMLRLALERADNARMAKSVIIALLEEYGQDACGGYRNKGLFYSNSFLIADGREAYLLETAERHWAWKKVHGFYAISNGLTIDDDYDGISDGCEKFACRKGFIKTGEKFSSRRAFSDWFFTFFSMSAQRRQLAHSLGDGKNEYFNLQNALKILRYEGGVQEEKSFYPSRSNMASICMHATGFTTPSQTAGSMVATIDASAGATVWLTGTGIPSLSLFLPFFMRGKTLLGGGEAGEPSARLDNSLWWRHALLYRRALSDYPRLSAPIRDYIIKEQKRLLEAEESISGRGGIDDAIAIDALAKWRDFIEGEIDRIGINKIHPRPFAPFYRIQWQAWNKQAGI